MKEGFLFPILLHFHDGQCVLIFFPAWLKIILANFWVRPPTMRRSEFQVVRVASCSWRYIFRAVQLLCNNQFLDRYGYETASLNNINYD